MDKWNMKNTKQLIQLFKEKRELWDPDYPDFRFRDKKYKAWEDMANKLGADRYDVEKKARSLAGQFQREIRKFGNGRGDIENCSKWFAFKSLMFLYNKNKSYKTTMEDDDDTDESESICQVTENDTEAYQKNEVPLKRDTVYKLKSQPRNEGPEKTNGPKGPNYVIVRPKPDRSLDATPTASSQPSDHRDEYHIFGDYIASKLRNLQDPFVINTIQNRICNIIYEAEVNKVNKNNDAYIAISDPHSYHTPRQSTSVASESEKDFSDIIESPNYHSDHNYDIKMTEEHLEDDFD